MNPKSKDNQSQESAKTDEQQIPIDGFQQVVDLLSAADPAFRESLLKRLALRDSSLAASLKRDLAHRT